MKQIQWLDTARHWVGKTLHWDAVRDAMHNAAEREREPEPEWVIAYETANGFCCLYKGEEHDFKEIEEARAWADEVDVQIYFIGL